MRKSNFTPRKFILPLIDFFYPKTCFTCDNLIRRSGNILCNSCFEKLKFLSEKRIQCHSCGMTKEKCQCNKLTDKKFAEVYSLFELNEELSKLIHKLKYNGYHSIGKFFPDNFIPKNKYNFFSDIDFIIPVPLHFLKKAARGYNQSEIIAKAISGKFNIPVRNDIVKRRKYTKSQTKLGREKRALNMANVFTACSNINLSDKNILITDDIITTTATVNECSNIISSLGANSIKIFSLARA